MRFTPIDGPSEEPISLSDQKAGLRVAHDAEDDQILQMARTARHFIERRWDVAFLSQRWMAEGSVPSCSPLMLRPRPVLSLETIEQRLPDGTDAALSLDDVRLHASTGRLELGEGAQPHTALRIVFTAGHPNAAAVPDDLIRALYLLTAHYFEEREIFRSERYVPVPLSVDALLAPYRSVVL